MKIYLRIFIAIMCMSSVANHSFGQTKNDVDQLYNDCQKCLDATGKTDKCQEELYDQLDSILNKAYQNLMQQLSSGEQIKLRDEERNWLKKRDLYFKKVETETKQKTAPDTEIFYTMVYEKRNEFVRSHLLDLINRNGKLEQ